MANGRSFLIRGVRVFDGTRVVEADSVRVDDGLIAEVGTRLAPRPGPSVVEGDGMTLIPGLIDGHTHTPPDPAHAEKALRQAVAFGVTTVICLSTDPTTAATMKRLAAERSDLADLRSSGWAATVAGGHPTHLAENGYPVVAGPHDAHRYVTDHIASGMDQVKIIIEDGTIVGRSFPRVPQELSDAITTEAHRRGLIAVAHVATERDALQAVASGVDGLAHQYMDKPLAPSIARRLHDGDIFVCMTLAACHNAEGSQLAQDPRVAPFMEPHWLEHLRRGLASGWPGETYLGNILSAVAGLRDSHVGIVAGTDAPMPGTGHGASLHHELALLVRGGLTPTEALKAATSAAADGYRLSDRGRIAEGMRADLVLVSGDPTTNIDASLDVRRIWRGGEVFDRDGQSITGQLSNRTTSSKCQVHSIRSGYLQEHLPRAIGSITALVCYSSPLVS